MVVACLLVFVLSPTSVLAQSSEIPGLQVTAELPETIHQAATFAVTFEVTNIGSSSYENVVVAPRDACDPSTDEGLVVFDEAAGNGDDVLDPTEVWTYRAPRCIDSAVEVASVDVSVFDGVETLSASYPFPYSANRPVEPESLGEVTADECLAEGIGIPFEVVTNTPLDVPRAFLEYAVPLDGGGLHTVDRVEFAEILHVSPDGDSVYEPGEQYVATFFFGSLAQCAEVPSLPLVLVLSMEGTSADSGAPWCFGTENCPYAGVVVGTITVLAQEEAPPPTDPTLPFTGPSDWPVLLASGLLAVGALLLAIGRRRGRAQSPIAPSSLQ
jgi:hypothetical protein